MKRDKFLKCLAAGIAAPWSLNSIHAQQVPRASGGTASSQPRVAAALQRCLELGEVGVQVAAYHRGRLIVDAWAGNLAVGGPGVGGESLFNVFSVGKTITATAIHIQVERGLVDYDAPVSRYWPEYGFHGKDKVTIRHVLQHRAGVPQMPADVTPEKLGDWTWMTARLAQVEPAYEPGSRNTYLSYVFGWILGEVVRRTDPKQRSFAAFVEDEICKPLGMDSFWFGVSQESESRVAQLSYPNQPGPTPPFALVTRAVPTAVDFVPTVYNLSVVRRACIPGAGGIGNARSMAKFFSMIAGRGEFGGRRMLNEKTLLDCLPPRPQSELQDETYGRPMQLGSGGFWISIPGVPLLENRAGRKILAHIGAGYSVGWADLDTGLSIAICHNRMFGALPENPWGPLTEAIFSVAGIPA